MSALSLSGVRKTFGPVTVVHGVDLDIGAGEFAVFVGPSGCGKSTLLRLIAGLEETSAGTIKIGGRDVTQLDPSERRIAMVFQSYALYPHMSVSDNIGFGLRMNGVPKAEVRRKVEDAAAILRLDKLLSRKPKQLSGGQRQRVAIGRAIVRNPEVFLFDEPLSNLDAELRVQMRLEIARLHKQIGATMIYVTHDQVEAMTLADKIVVLRDGCVEQVGSPLALYRDPDNLFVAGFIGSPRMNFLGAQAVRRPNGSLVAKLTDFDVDIPLSLTSADLSPGAALTLGIRPEHFSIDGPVSLGVTVDLVERLGNLSLVYARQGGEAPLTMEWRGDDDLAPGDSIAARFDPSRCFYFDTATGARLR
jgi:lactose/L-arabinose transport system ATP-binding protein